MTFLTHILAGLIIGKITGDFPTAIIGSLIMDSDHIISFFRHGILFNLKKMIEEMLDEKDPWGDQRNFLHNILIATAISLLVLLINFKTGLVFLIAYFFHLLFDALNISPLYPFFPSKKFATKGIIRYNSKQEIMFDGCLTLILAVLFIIKI